MSSASAKKNISQEYTPSSSNKWPTHGDFIMSSITFFIGKPNHNDIIKFISEEDVIEWCEIRHKICIENINMGTIIPRNPLTVYKNILKHIPEKDVKSINKLSEYKILEYITNGPPELLSRSWTHIENIVNNFIDEVDENDLVDWQKKIIDILTAKIEC